MADWNERYKRGEHADAVPHPLIVRFTATLPPGRALDVACGPGRHALFLAKRGWAVTAVDNSEVAIDILLRRAREQSLAVNAVIADLEQHEFNPGHDAFDLIIVCNYLQRDLFPAIREATRTGGTVIAVIAMVDDDPGVKPMNPAFLLNPGELPAAFDGWEIVHVSEGKPDGGGRAMAEIVARKTPRLS